MIQAQKPRVPKLELTLPEILKLMPRTADGMFVIDLNGKIIVWNLAASKILGYRAEEVIGKPCYEILSGRDSFGNSFCFSKCSVMTMAKQNQLIQNYDTQVITKKTRKIWLNTSILLIQNKAGTDPLIVHLFRPIASPDRVKCGTIEARLNPEPCTSLLLPEEKQPSPPSLSAPLSLKHPVLTQRETEVFVLMSRCLVAKEIASKLKISTNTARSHIQNILKKLKVHSKLEAVLVAEKQGLLHSS